MPTDEQPLAADGDAVLDGTTPPTAEELAEYNKAKAQDGIQAFIDAAINDVDEWKAAQ